MKIGLVLYISNNLYLKSTYFWLFRLFTRVGEWEAYRYKQVQSTKYKQVQGI